MKRTLIKSLIALAISVAPGVISAQTDPQKKPDEQPESRGGSPDKPPKSQPGQQNNTLQGETTKQQPAAEQGEAQGKRSEKGSMSEKQHGELREAFSKAHVEPAPNVDFSIEVGGRVPKEVGLHRLPPRIVEMIPEYEGYEYFILADGRIVIVDPETLEIVLAIK